MTLNNNTLNGTNLYELLLGGYLNLCSNMDYIDSLNVFPVPDGDTGKNMVASLKKAISDTKDITDATRLSQEFAKLCLFYARGNSGVILSQFFNGISKYLQSHGNPESITLKVFAMALKNGYKQALSAVLSPVEGTILTVLRESTEYLADIADQIHDINEFFVLLTQKTKQSLEQTPNLLSVLKEAGVVDAGGAGILCIFEGMKAVAEGKNINANSLFNNEQQAERGSKKFNDSAYSMRYGYCTEFILQTLSGSGRKEFDKENCVAFLSSIGNSIVAVQDQDIVKIHVHTFRPEKVLEYARQFGELLTVKIENMDVQNLNADDTPEKPKKHLKNAIVAVANGQGVREYFTQIGADFIIDAGQTQNPSTQDFINAFNQLDAENIIVLPNNKNIVLSALQAKKLYKGANVYVIETTSIAEGYSALSMLDNLATDVQDLLSSMQRNLKNVTTGLVAMANKDTVLNDIKIFNGHYLSIVNGNIKACCKDKNDAVIELLGNTENIEDKQTFVIFVGADVSDDEKNCLLERLEEIYPLCDVAVIDGNQPVYSYVLSIE